MEIPRMAIDRPIAVDAGMRRLHMAIQIAARKIPHIARGAARGWSKMDVECPNCGGRIDSHAGRIDDGRVFVCEKGRPPMREAGYRCRHCGSTVILLEKCEPKGVDHD